MVSVGRLLRWPGGPTPRLAPPPLGCCPFENRAVIRARTEWGIDMAGQPVRQRIVVPFAGHVIGEGFNSDTVERVGTGLSVASVGDDPQAPGQTAVFKFHMLTSQASLEKALNFGAELEARYLLFSAGGKFSFAEQSAINSTSTYIVASCLVTNALRFGTGFTPTPPRHG